MSCRGTIGVLNEDGTVQALYLHDQAYPGMAGRILVNHYQPGPRIEQLLALGGLSILGIGIGQEHPFDPHQAHSATMHPDWRNWCLAYIRDRGESVKGNETRTWESKDYYRRTRFYNLSRFRYLLDADGEWKVWWTGRLHLGLRWEEPYDFAANPTPGHFYSVKVLLTQYAL